MVLGQPADPPEVCAVGSGYGTREQQRRNTTENGTPDKRHPPESVKQNRPTFFAVSVSNLNNFGPTKERYRL